MKENGNQTPYELLMERQNAIRIKKLNRAKKNLQRSGARNNSNLTIMIESVPLTNFSQEQRKLSVKSTIEKRQCTFNGLIERHNRPRRQFLTPVMPIKNSHYRDQSYLLRKSGGLLTIDPEGSPPELGVCRLRASDRNKKLKISQESPKASVSWVQSLCAASGGLKKRLRQQILSRQHQMQVKSRETHNGRHQTELPTKTSLDCSDEFQPWVEVEKTPRPKTRVNISRNFKRNAFSKARLNDIQPWQSNGQDESLW